MIFKSLAPSLRFIKHNIKLLFEIIYPLLNFLKHKEVNTLNFIYQEVNLSCYTLPPRLFFLSSIVILKSSQAEYQ